MPAAAARETAESRRQSQTRLMATEQMAPEWHQTKRKSTTLWPLWLQPQSPEMLARRAVKIVEQAEGCHEGWSNLGLVSPIPWRCFEGGRCCCCGYC